MARPSKSGRGAALGTDRDRAFARGRAGKSATDAIRADPGLLAAYDQGKAELVDSFDSRPAAPHLPPAPTRSAGAQGPSRLGRAATAAQSQSDKVVRRQLSAAGDGGGLLLAFILYPIALSVLKYGAAGPGKWFRAKWLNATDKQPNNLGAVPLTNGNPTYHTAPLPIDPNAVPNPGAVPRRPDGSVILPPGGTA